MQIIRHIVNTILDSLFPLSDTEKELFDISPESAIERLQTASDYSGLAISADESRCMRSIFAYKDERVEKLVWNIKYKRLVKAMRIGGYVLWREILKSTKDGVLVIPIPITKKRRLERGYNQCELLIDEIERLERSRSKTESSIDDPEMINRRLIFQKKLLERIQHSSRQTLKGRHERVESAKGIFAINENVAKNIPKGTQIIIIDDVITTGSTMKSAIDTLRSAGYENVRGLSLAH